MATIKPATQLRVTDTHSTLGAISVVRRIGGRVFVKFGNHVTRWFHACEHVSVQ